MGFRSLVSLAMVILPIGATLGILLGIDSYRAAKGEVPLFTDTTSGTNQYCQKSYGITPAAVGQQYTLNPNQWGWNEGEAGGLCMDITTFANSTYATSSTAPPFSVTWSYPPADPTQPVHAFPNIELDVGSTLPELVERVSSVWVDVRWTYGAGNKRAKSIDESALTTADLNANVAFDLFLDSDPDKSTSTTQSTYEVMVWLARFGAATDPIGWGKIVTTRTVGDYSFDLYTGTNQQGQHVMTWYSATPATPFAADIKPLLQGLEQYNGPRSIDYLGYMGFGSETLYSGRNVTFDVPSLEMQVKTR